MRRSSDRATRVGRRPRHVAFRTASSSSRTLLGSLAAAVAVIALSGCGGSSSAADTTRSITVAAASDLRPAFEKLGALFESDTGITVTFAFGSSGQLREQIINGAPFDLFASANRAFVDDVIAAGRGLEDTRSTYAIGRIVLWTPPGTDPPASIDALADARYERIAIANPTHAPYGLAAEQALAAGGVLEVVRARLVYGENISDAFRIVQSGNADAGIVALSLAIADGGPYSLVPDHLHETLEQQLVVTSTGDRAVSATEFAEFIASPAGRAVMTRYGFVLPGEALPGAELPDPRSAAHGVADG